MNIVDKCVNVSNFLIKKNQIILETTSGNRCEYSFYHPDDLKAILKIIQKSLKNS